MAHIFGSLFRADTSYRWQTMYSKFKAAVTLLWRLLELQPGLKRGALQITLSGFMAPEYMIVTHLIRDSLEALLFVFHLLHFKIGFKLTTRLE